MNHVKEKIILFNEARDWDQFHSPENLAKSISIESGELLECFQWNSKYDLDEVSDELADILNYCILLSAKLGLDIEEIILRKLNKNELKYPVEKAKGVSTKYNKFED